MYHICSQTLWTAVVVVTVVCVLTLQSVNIYGVRKSEHEQNRSRAFSLDALVF